MPSKRKTTMMKKSSGSLRGVETRNRASRAIEDEDTDTEVDSSFQCEESVFEVERVIGKAYDERGDISYNLKWKGYDESSWERKENCSCNKLIDNYENFLARRYGRLGPEVNGVGGSASPQAHSSPTSNQRRSNGHSEVVRRTSNRFK